VTLLQIADLVRAGEDVQIIDNATKEDKTEVTLALIISEELKSRPRSVPLGTLRGLIHQRSEKLLSQLREGPIGRLIPGSEDRPDDSPEPSGEPPPPAGRAESATLDHPRTAPSEGAPRAELTPFEQLRHAIDERIRMILPAFVGSSDLQQKVDQLAHRVAALELEIARRDAKP
jgi:hypothetical protein